MPPCDVQLNDIEATSNDLGWKVAYVRRVMSQLNREAKALLKTLLQCGNLFRVKGEAANGRFALSLSRLKQRQVFRAGAGSHSTPCDDQQPDQESQCHASERIADCSHQPSPFTCHRDG